MEPLISVIIPIYKAEKYIEKCIELLDNNKDLLEKKDVKK